MGVTLKGKNLLPWHWGLLLMEKRSKFFPLRVTPKLEMIQLVPLKLKIKKIFIDLSEGMEKL